MTPTHYTQNPELTTGVAVEHMVQLANITEIDPWFCIPTRASDDYVTQLATLIRDSLDTSLTAHIEYGNEVWNGSFGLRHGAGTDPGRIFPGMKMAGRMGNQKVSVKNLRILNIDNENNLIFIKGSLPGPNNRIVYLNKS